MLKVIAFAEDELRGEVAIRDFREMLTKLVERARDPMGHEHADQEGDPKKNHLKRHEQGEDILLDVTDFFHRRANRVVRCIANEELKKHLDQERVDEAESHEPGANVNRKPKLERFVDEEDASAKFHRIKF